MGHPKLSTLTLGSMGLSIPCGPLSAHVSFHYLCRNGLGAYSNVQDW